MPRFRRSSRRPRRNLGNAVIHVPSTMAASIAANTLVIRIISSPSIFAAGSASSNIEAQDKDRTVNVGHHIGRLNLDKSIRSTLASGVVEWCVFKVERADSTPAIASHPVPSQAEVIAQGMQQACRMANPGKVFHYSKRVYTVEAAITHKIIVSPAKFKLSKCKAGDHWVMLVFNRGGGAVVYDYEARYKEYE